MRRIFIGFSIFVLVVGVFCFAFHTAILRHLATHLIQEDEPKKADALFVLSGGGFDRGNEAVKLYKAGYAPKIICTGGNEENALKVFNIDTLESDATAANLRRQGVPDSVIIEIREGTSTKEEANIIECYCIEKNLHRIIVLSSKIHTYRVNDVFRKRLKGDGIDLIVRGAASSQFDEMNWWKSENGLIAINNEWLKNFYYRLKY